MIRTLEFKTFQIRFNAKFIAIFWGVLHTRAIKIFWWDHPRIVLDLTDRNPIVIGRRYR